MLGRCPFGASSVRFISAKGTTPTPPRGSRSTARRSTSRTARMCCCSSNRGGYGRVRSEGSPRRRLPAQLAGCCLRAGIATHCAATRELPSQAEVLGGGPPGHQHPSIRADHTRGRDQGEPAMRPVGRHAERPRPGVDRARRARPTVPVPAVIVIDASAMVEALDAPLHTCDAKLDSGGHDVTVHLRSRTH